MRYSLQREAVYEAVRSTDCHPDAEWVYRQVQRVMPDISLATVYRNLKELSSHGFVDVLEVDKILRFDGNTEPHAHFICSQCGRIIDLFPGKKASELIDTKGCLVKREAVLFYGLCTHCNSSDMSAP